MSSVSLLFLIIVSFYIVQAIDNGLGKTPPMGWSNSQIFPCNITQQIITNTVDKLVQIGLTKLGYNYINIDDCWQDYRNQTTGQIKQDSLKFPNGISSLSKYIHSKGLKIGLYSSASIKTSFDKPGSYGYQQTDANTFAKWEIDYLKYDNCNNPDNTSSKLRFYTMQKSLNLSGRAIFFSLINAYQERVWQWGTSISNSWRTTQRISSNWNSFINILQKQVGLQKYAQKGGWNDAGTLQIGIGSMSFNEKYAHFAFWCVLKNPLIIGADINNISSQTLQIIGNEQLIELNQDILGVEAKRIKSQIGSIFKRQVWGGPLTNNRYVLLFLNRGEGQTQISISLRNDVQLSFSSYTQRDPIRHTNIGITNKDILSNKVSAHSVEVRILSLIKQDFQQ